MATYIGRTPMSGTVIAVICIEHLPADAWYEDGSIATYNAGNKDHLLEEKMDLLDWYNEVGGDIYERLDDYPVNIIGLPDLRESEYILRVQKDGEILHYVIWMEDREVQGFLDRFSNLKLAFIYPKEDEDGRVIGQKATISSIDEIKNYILEWSDPLLSPKDLANLRSPEQIIEIITSGDDDYLMTVMLAEEWETQSEHELKHLDD